VIGFAHEIPLRSSWNVTANVTAKAVPAKLFDDVDGPSIANLCSISQRAIVFAFATRTKKTPMPQYLGALTIVLLLGMVLTRVFLLKRQGIKALKFGSIDKTDFLIPPFALFYFYVLFAAAFDWPNISARPFFHSEAVAWTGVLFCVAGLFLLLWSLISFRQSFRIGIDTDHADELIVDGAFVVSRNPIYVAFAMVLMGEFLIFPNWITLIYLVAATGLMHRQVLREEDYLKGHYGEAYEQYCHRVRRYL
jgi:protein-S-isoprenylcysteine O-methyltransferase Ste14